MGIPSGFRWLSQKYPKIISRVIEEQSLNIDNHEIPVDATKPNPNGEEFDNLYLDMNNIVHPCSHPEDRPAPSTEEDMMLAVFEYTDRIVRMVRPRKLLMLAVGMSITITQNNRFPDFTSLRNFLVSQYSEIAGGVCFLQCAFLSSGSLIEII